MEADGNNLRLGNLEASTSRMLPLVVGVAGGTGSGKTTVSRYIYESIGPERVVLLQHDSYYRDQSNLSP